VIDAADRLSGRRLAAVLALTALPVVATRGIYWFAPPPNVDWLRPAYLGFVVYALANWVTFALVVAVAGWPALRGCGLRLRLSPWRVLSACAGFVAGVTIYTVVSAELRRWHLPPVGGMDFVDPTWVELAFLFVSTVLTAAFCEEVFFRVLWIGALRRHVPIAVAVLASVVAFAAIHIPHFGLGGGVFIVVWSIVPVALFLAFEDCGASTFMHMMNNAFAYILVPLLFHP
jgi:membrane protease YdiL (CAAX protease family)